MIENTSNRDPLIHMLGAMSDGTENYITGMEAAGQHQLVNSEQMPAEGPWGELEALGFIKGDPVPGDPLFIHATLPAGWRKERTDHSMHTRIVDERGIERVSIFYKAAYYDRRADFNVVNVGTQLAIYGVWGDEPAALPDRWDVLTKDERHDYTAALAQELERNLEYQQYYTGDELAERIAHASRIRAFQALVAEEGSR